MAGVTQNVSRLNQKQVMALMENRGLAANGTEYCPAALLARLVELKEKSAAKYEKSEKAVLDHVNAALMPPVFPPAIKKARKTKIVAKPVFNLIGHGIEKLVFPKSKIKFEVRY